MSCSINRYKFVGNGGCDSKKESAETAELDTRMKEMMAIRAAQDTGDFKFRPGFTSPLKITKDMPTFLTQYEGKDTKKNIQE